MSVVSFTVVPTQAQTSTPTDYVFPTGITQSKIDTVKFMNLMWHVKRMFSDPGVITTTGDTVSITVTIDGTNT